MIWSNMLDKQSLDLSQELYQRASEEAQKGITICPPIGQIFRALSITHPDMVKVCIVGQDPYHTPGVANGLSFSTAADNKIPPSLNNIFKELDADLGIKPKNGDLTLWAEKGVLLLNSTLTVEAGKPNSHADWGWDQFTLSALKLATTLPQPIVFILWGAYAQKLFPKLLSRAMIWEDEGHIARENLIKKAYILSSHPSPFSARKKCGNSPSFIGSRPFSTANRLLVEMDGEPIDWSL